jgi:restriction system protein
MAKSHGLWRVTPAGSQAWRDFPDPAVFIRTATRIRNARKARLRPLPDCPPRADASAAEPQGPSATAASDELGCPALTLPTARARAWTEIQAFVARLSAYEFQQLTADLLRALGWQVAWIAAPGKDGGVDIVAFRDPLGATARRLKVQVTQGDRPVDIARVRSFLAVLHEDDIGVFVSLRGFTRDAEEFARVHARRRVTLLDLEGFVELWGEHYAKLDDRARRRLPLMRVLFLAPEAISHRPSAISTNLEHDPFKLIHGGAH